MNIIIPTCMYYKITQILLPIDLAVCSKSHKRMLYLAKFNMVAIYRNLSLSHLLSKQIIRTVTNELSMYIKLTFLYKSLYGLAIAYIYSKKLVHVNTMTQYLPISCNFYLVYFSTTSGCVPQLLFLFTCPKLSLSIQLC